MGLGDELAPAAAMPTEAAHAAASMRGDRRNTRWNAHRAAKRRELVEATLRCIRDLGPRVGMDEIAAAAGTSKPVLYRHFGDRTGLYLAVVDSVTEYIQSRIAPALDADSPFAVMVADLADSYLELIERDENIYRFVLSRPQLDTDADPLTGVSERIGQQVSDAIARRRRAARLDDEVAVTWGHGIVGFVRATANVWLNTPDRRPRADLVAEVADFFAPFDQAAGPTSRRKARGSAAATSASSNLDHAAATSPSSDSTLTPLTPTIRTSTKERS